MKGFAFYSWLLFSHSVATTAFQFSTPHLPWVAVIDKVDLASLSNEDIDLLTRECFEKCPVMVFKHQKQSTAKEFFDLVCKFDPDVDMQAIEEERVLHPFRREPDAPHVAIREEKSAKHTHELGDQFRFGPVWHMDLVGSDKCNVPNVVSAFHFLQTPTLGGETMFCNLEIAYASLPPDVRKTVDSLECIYDNDLESLLKIRYNGFERLGPFPEGEEAQVIRPLIYRDSTTQRKRMFFTPTRFNRFTGWSREESWEFMTHIFYSYIYLPQNTASIAWEEGDIAVFNNHRLIHTSTPWEIYKGQNRRFRLCFLNSKKMYEETQLVT